MELDTHRVNRSRGRPRKRWKDVVGETLDRCSMPNLEVRRYRTLQDKRMETAARSSDRGLSLIWESTRREEI